MKPTSALLAMLIWIALSCFAVAGPESNQYNPNKNAIDRIIGDISYVEKFGVIPDDRVDEDLRIRTRLEYVEKLLRSKNVDGLSSELRSARALNLDRLHDYWTQGTFPRNYDHQEGRTPCFIDCYGRICAVGYLLEQSLGRKAAEYVNSRFKHSWKSNALLFRIDFQQSIEF